MLKINNFNSVGFFKSEQKQNSNVGSKFNSASIKDSVSFTSNLKELAALTNDEQAILSKIKNLIKEKTEDKLLFIDMGENKEPSIIKISHLGLNMDDVLGAWANSAEKLFHIQPNREKTGFKYHIFTLPELDIAKYGKAVELDQQVANRVRDMRGASREIFLLGDKKFSEAVSGYIDSVLDEGLNAVLDLTGITLKKGVE